MFIYSMPELYSCNSIISFFSKGGAPINASISLYVKVSFFRSASANYKFRERNLLDI